MHRLTFTKNYIVLKLFCRRGAHTNESDLGKNVLYGGLIREPYERRSLGRILYDRLRDPSRADKIIQVCSSTGYSMTTQTFLKQSVAVAEGLRERNVRKGDFILLVGNNSLNMNIALAGVLILGAVAVPISYFANPDDLRHLLTFIQPKFFICDGQTLFTIRRIVSSVLGQLDENKICLLNDCKYLSPGLQCFPEFIKGKGEKWDSFKPVEVKHPGEELALVMKSFVEGAANRGVGLTHTNLLSLISRHESAKNKELSSEVILMVQKIIWMSGIYSVLSACCFGSKLIVMSEFDEELFMKSIDKHKVTTCFLYPAKLWQLYKHTYPETYDLSSCKRLYAVGAGVPRLLVTLMKEKTGLKIKPAYGLTEMTGIVIEQPEKFKEGSMGQLVPMLYAKVISSSSHQKHGPNTPGELCFKGPTLMKGYVNDEKATRDSIDKDGFLHTGDYGYYDEEGYFFIWDKLKSVIRYKNYEIAKVPFSITDEGIPFPDAQSGLERGKLLFIFTLRLFTPRVKVFSKTKRFANVMAAGIFSGFNTETDAWVSCVLKISPLEIEGVLKSLDSVKDCVVSGIAHSKDGHHVVAFVVLQPGKTVTAEEIKTFIASKFPEHKHLRGGVVFIPKVPRSRESGFIKRSAINKVLSKYRLITEQEDQKKTVEQKKVDEETKKVSNTLEAAAPPPNATGMNK